MAEGNKEAALAWANALFDAIKKLEQFPEMGRAVPEIKRNSIRELLHGKYRVIYRFDKDEVAILSVRHGKRKLRARDIERRRK